MISHLETSGDQAEGDDERGAVAALIDGEQSGFSTPLDFDQFLAQKRAGCAVAAS